MRWALHGWKITSIGQSMGNAPTLTKDPTDEWLHLSTCYLKPTQRSELPANLMTPNLKIFSFTYMPTQELKCRTNLTSLPRNQNLSPTMALVIYGYDLVCFAVVAAAIFAAFWVIIQRKGVQKSIDDSKYESLLLSEGSDGNRFFGSTQNGEGASAQLWMTCWKGLHPGWLLATRAVSGIVMAGFLAWDIRCYDSSIFVYYTEYVRSCCL
ncbi:hypothetical protein ACLOJK_021972 [Asimina triloba]